MYLVRAVPIREQYLRGQRNACEIKSGEAQMLPVCVLGWGGQGACPLVHESVSVFLWIRPVLDKART